MKSVCYMVPGIELVDVPEPQLVHADDVKIKVAYAGICGGDIHFVDSELDHFNDSSNLFQGFKPGQKVPLGHEVSGTVYELGPAATAKNLKVGDKVGVYLDAFCGNCYFCRSGHENFCLNMELISGGMSEFVVMREQSVYKLPQNVGLQTGALLEPVSMALGGVDWANFKTGDKVLILGAGAMGLLMTQIAKMSGAAMLTVSDPVPEKRILAIKYGADFVIDPVKQDALKEGMAITDGLGYDAVIETSGAMSALYAGYQLTSRGGTLEIFSMIFNKKFELDLGDAWVREITIKTFFHHPYYIPKTLRLLEMLDLEEFTKSVFVPEDCKEAFLYQKTGKPPKVMFKFA